MNLQYIGTEYTQGTGEHIPRPIHIFQAAGDEFALPNAGRVRIVERCGHDLFSYLIPFPAARPCLLSFAR